MNRITKGIASGIAACAIAVPLVTVPTNAFAQRSEHDRRQQTKNEWRNIAIGSGALAILGLINKDRTSKILSTCKRLTIVRMRCTILLFKARKQVTMDDLVHEGRLS